MKTKCFYTKAVDRLRKAGITDPTAQIAALEEEIDGYRNQIDLKAVKIENDEVQEDKTVPKHPSYNCKRGMLCPSCDKALWVRVEIKSIFGKKAITVKEQPNFCKYCGQALKPAYA